MSSRILWGSALLIASGACGSDSSVTANMGSVQLALASTGPDGARYEFVDAIAEVGLENGTTRIPLAGSESTVQVTLPTSDSASLRILDDEGPASANNSLTLTRTAPDGSQTSVEGYLLGPTMPHTFTVESSGVHSVALRVEVASVGDITFDAGRLDVTLQVTNGTAGSPARLNAQGPVSFSGQIFGDTASPLLRDQTNFAAAGDLHTSLAATLTTPFELLTQDYACAIGTAAGLSTTSAHAGWRAFIADLGPDARVEFCISNQPSGDQISVLARREAVASPQLDMPSGAYIWLQATTTLNQEVFDGVNLRLSQLTQPVTLGSVGSYGSGSTGFLFQNFGQGALTLTFSP